MKVNPLEDLVLVKQRDPETKTESGLILLPASSEDKTQIGTVMAVGPEVTTVSVGESVLYDKYGGTKLDVEGKPHQLFRIHDILAKVEL